MKDKKYVTKILLVYLTLISISIKKSNPVGINHSISVGDEGGCMEKFVQKKIDIWPNEQTTNNFKTTI